VNAATGRVVRSSIPSSIGTAKARSLLAGSFLVSYARARAESLGIECREGMLQRPERYVLLGGASMIGTVVRHLFCSVPARDVVMAVGISTLAVLANATAFQRMRSAVRRLG